ncbi:MAG: hypothetical protein WC412_01995 [Candidatus Omnitrophota bacterium]|jgi:hypothetical protein
MQKTKTKKVSVDFDTLKRVIDYLEPEEKRHYEEFEVRPRWHIWLSVKKLKKEIEGNTKNMK